MAVFCERTAADPGLLARPDVQKLTPYQSARRIMQAAGVRRSSSTAIPSPSPRPSSNAMRPMRA